MSPSAEAVAWVAELGGWAYLAAPLLMAVVALLPIPAEAPAMMNGILFGPWVGSLMSWTGAMAGAWASFELARRFGRAAVCRWVGPAGIARTERFAEGAGWWGLLVLRLTPVVAFTALNYGLGLAGVPRRRFLWTTAVGIAPGAVLFTSSGAGLGYLWDRSTALGWLALAGVVVASFFVYRRRIRRGAAEAPRGTL